jgi:hypothetical protein
MCRAYPPKAVTSLKAAPVTALQWRIVRPVRR